MDITIYEHNFRYLNIYICIYTYMHKAQGYRGYGNTYRTTVQGMGQNTEDLANHKSANDY